MLRLAGFLRRNGHPHQSLDPDVDGEAKAILERFHIDPGKLPIVLCQSGSSYTIPPKTNLPAV